MRVGEVGQRGQHGGRGGGGPELEAGASGSPGPTRSWPSPTGSPQVELSVEPDGRPVGRGRPPQPASEGAGQRSGAASARRAGAPVIGP